MEFQRLSQQCLASHRCNSSPRTIIGGTLMTSLRARTRIEEGFLPTEASISSRKVSRSGHVSYQGKPYFISKSLAGRYIRVVEFAGCLIIDASIPVYKEYSL